MSSFPQHEENMNTLFEMYPEFKDELRSLGYEVDDHWETWSCDELVCIVAEIIILMKKREKEKIC